MFIPSFRYYSNSLKGHSLAPAHPDGFPKEQGVKRHYKSGHTDIINVDSRTYRWTDRHTDRHINRPNDMQMDRRTYGWTDGHILIWTEGHIDGQKDRLTF